MASRSRTTADLKVLCGGALREILLELGDRYLATAGIRILSEFATSAAIRDRVRNGAAFDVVITTHPAIAELSAQDKVLADSVAPIARSGIGLAVRTGQNRPDISSTQAFVATLRSAHSIAFADPAFGTPSGVYLAQLFGRLGLTAELKPKMRPIGAVGGAPVVVCEVVAKGEAELGLQQISEIVAVPGVDLVGPLPPEVQHLTVFAAAVATTSRNVNLARNLAAFLTTGAAKSVIAAHGMEPFEAHKPSTQAPY